MSKSTAILDSRRFRPAGAGRRVRSQPVWQLRKLAKRLSAARALGSYVLASEFVAFDGSWTLWELKTKFSGTGFSFNARQYCFVDADAGWAVYLFGGEARPGLNQRQTYCIELRQLRRA